MGEISIQEQTQGESAGRVRETEGESGADERLMRENGAGLTIAEAAAK